MAQAIKTRANAQYNNEDGAKYNYEDGASHNDEDGASHVSLLTRCRD